MTSDRQMIHFLCYTDYLPISGTHYMTIINNGNEIEILRTLE